MPVFEFLAAKGIAVIAKIIAAKGMGATVAHSLLQSIQTYGLSQVLGTSMAVGAVVGGVAWTADRVNNVRKGIKGLEEGNLKKAVKNFGELAINSHIDVQMLPDAVHDFLVNVAKVSDKKATVVAQVVEGLEDEIAGYVKKAG